jgi:hypothetical protein
VRKLYLAFVLIAFGSCKPEYLSPEALTAFVADENNGCATSAKIGETTIAVTYRPTDLLVHQETGDVAVDPKKLEALRQKYAAYYYFILSLSHNNKEALHQSSGEQYSDLVQTLSFRMAEYVTLTTAASDTIPVGDFMLNRTFGMSPSTDLLFVFSKEKAKEKEWVQFNLNEFGLGVGNQRFRFRTKDLEGLPEIKFEGL